MSTHLEVVKSESVSCSDRVRVENDGGRSAPRRTTIFERQDITALLTPMLIAAIQQEIVELQSDFEKKLQITQNQADRRLYETLKLASTERLESENLRLNSREQWETGTSSSGSKRIQDE